MIVAAAEVARRRRDRGLKPNCPEAVAIMNAELLEGARDGGSVADLMSFGATIFPRGRDGGRRRDGGRGRAVGATFPDDTKLITVHDPSSRAPWYVVGRPVRRQANLVLRFLLEPCALAALFVFEPRVGRHTGEVPRAARGPVRPCRSGAARPRLPWRGRGRAGGRR